LDNKWIWSKLKLLRGLILFWIHNKR
jgi:hypothetical protein